MKIENLFQIILISFLVFAACKAKPGIDAVAQQITIALSSDSTSVELRRVPEHILQYLRTDSLTQKEWQTFFSVYPDVSNPEIRDLQLPLGGNYLVRDSLILFIPTTKFERDSSYFARFYSRKLIDKPSDVIRGKKLFEDSKVVEFGFKR